MKRRMNKKGFTLVELIIVIAIIAILAALLVPSMVGYLEEARTTTKIANARTVYSAAAAAEAMCIANGITVTSIGSASALVDASTLTVGTTTFAGRVAGLLGSINGALAIIVDSNGHVVSTMWGDSTTDAAPGSYTPGN